MRAVIQHHPKRRHLLPGLLEALPGAEVVSDPKPEAGVSPWRCYRACLQRALEIGGTVVIVQDDVVPCPYFLEVAARAAAVKPDDPVAFFITGRYTLAKQAKTAAVSGHRYVLIQRGPDAFIPVVATAWPQAKTEHFLKWAAGYAPEARDLVPGFRADDGITGKWLSRNRQQAWLTIPNLVEHPDFEPTLVERRSDLVKSKSKTRERRTSSVPWVGDPREIVWEPCVLSGYKVS